MPGYLLLGLCEPLSDEDQAAFDEWFIDQHIEDTSKCPRILSGGSVYRLAGPHLDLATGSAYLSLYEVESSQLRRS